MASLAGFLLWFHHWLFALSVPTCTAAFVFTIASLPNNRRRILLLRNRTNVSGKHSDEVFPFSYDDLEIEVEIEDSPDLELSIYRYLNEKTDLPVLAHATLVEDLGLSDAQLGETIYELLAMNGREYSPGLFTYPLITVEDLVLYIEASPRVEIESSEVSAHPVSLPSVAA
jgi:hypothetical protein